MVAVDWDAGDATLSRDILGTPDKDEATARIAQWLAGRGYGDAEIMAIELSVGAAVTLRLDNGSGLFAKFWSPSVDHAALAAQLEVQNVMASRGFPAARVRSGLEPFGDGCGVIMDFDHGGAATDVRIPGVSAAMAEGLASLVRDGEDLRATPNLPHRKWTASLWPKPHNVLFNFNETAKGAEWIDRIAQANLEILRSQPGRQVVGHLDWSAKNMRMQETTIAVVYDWDSIFIADEADVVGSAAASFPTTWEVPVSAIPTTEQCLAFVDDYERARGKAFTSVERTRVLANASYCQCYTARCDHALDPERAYARWAKVLGTLA